MRARTLSATLLLRIVAACGGSAAEAPGAYFVCDSTNNARSAIFKIDQQVYKGILKAAMRMYFYQRSSRAVHE
jgi:hypothetical protein